jgi:SAM-dependent methyltransferase
VDVRELVLDHYGDGDGGLADRILTALTGSGVDVDHLTIEDLTPVDQLHAGFGAATGHVLDRLGDLDGRRLLDVGSGIGGPARIAAARLARSGGSVTGVDLTPDFVATARTLTERVGLGRVAHFEVTDGERLPADDAAFDAAMMIHVGMNVPDKRALFAEVRRALVDGGRFVLYDQMRITDGTLPYPLPWAVDERSSFVEGPREYAAHLTAAGFEVEDVEDRTAAVAGPPPEGADGQLTPGVLFGAEFRERIANNILATQRGELGAILVVARAV